MSAVMVVQRVDLVEWRLTTIKAVQQTLPANERYHVFEAQLGGIWVAVHPSVQVWTDDLKSRFQQLCTHCGPRFLERYRESQEKEGMSVADHPEATDIVPRNGRRQPQSLSTRPSIEVARIIERRIVGFRTFESGHTQDESSTCPQSEALPQEWFRVEDSNKDEHWVRLCHVENVEVLQMLFVKELLQSMLSLHHMVGLATVKTLLQDMLNERIASAMRGVAARPARFIPLLAFIGNPGTGKTEVAKLTSSLYWLLGDLRYGHTCQWIGPALTGAYLGQTAPKTAWAWRQAHGGVFFLDEAYALAQGDSQYGQAALNVLVGLADPASTQTGLVVAGYELEMKKYFYQRNAGLMSRMTTCAFPDYSAEELCEIWTRKVAFEGFTFELSARRVFLEGLQAQIAFWPRSFGNARAINRLFDIMRRELNTRVCSNNRIDACQLTEADVRCALREFNSGLTLSEDDFAQIQQFAANFARSNTVDEFVRQEEDLRAKILRYLPSVPRTTCLACGQGKYVALASGHDAYCNHCFFRLGKCTSTEDCVGDYDLQTHRCSGCGQRASVPGVDAQMHGAVDPEVRLQQYGASLEEVRTFVTEMGADPRQSYYIICNRLAGMFSLLNGTLLPGAHERNQAVDLIMQVRILFPAPVHPDAERMVVSDDPEEFEMAPEQEQDEQEAPVSSAASSSSNENPEQDDDALLVAEFDRLVRAAFFRNNALIPPEERHCTVGKNRFLCLFRKNSSWYAHKESFFERLQMGDRSELWKHKITSVGALLELLQKAGRLEEEGKAKDMRAPSSELPKGEPQKCIEIRLML